MGYHSQLEGEIRVDPPIQWIEMKNTPFVPTGNYRDEYDRLLWLKVEEQTAHTPEGVLIRRTAPAIRVSNGDELRVGDGLAKELQDMIRKFARTPDGQPRTFTGTLLVTGECSPDVWRVRVVDNQAVLEVPKLLWPNGEEEEIRV